MEPGLAAHEALVAAIREGDARAAVKAAKAISAPLVARARPAPVRKRQLKST